MTIEDKRKVAKSEKNIQLIVAPKKQKIEIIKEKLQLLETERHEFPDENILSCALLWVKKKFYEQRKYIIRKIQKHCKRKKKNQMTYNCK